MQELHLSEFRASTRRWLLGSFAGWLTLVTSFVGVGLIVVLVMWLRNVSTRYSLSDQRLIIHHGILMNSEDEIELFRVEDIRVDYSIVNQLTGIGIVSLLSTDRTTRGQWFSMPNIPDARGLRETMCG